MALARRSQNHRGPALSIHSPSTARKHSLKRVKTRLSSDASTETTSSPLPRRIRPPLVPLHSNHRRQLSGTRSPTKVKDVEEVMREMSHVTTGSKRKRVVSSNENAHGRATRGVKRQRVAVSRIPYNLSASEESESEVEEMEVDLGSSQGTQTDDSDVSEEQDGNEDEQVKEEDNDSSNDFYIYEASQKSLSKLLKWRLIELYQMAGFTESAESLKKSELIDALISAREDGISIPPSSPGRADASSDGQSSDDGHFAGDEETDAPARHPSNGRQLLRRATLYDLTPRPKHLNNRSVSLGNILGNGQSSKLFLEESVDEAVPTTKRRASARSSPSANGATRLTQSPPITRLRSRTASGSLPDTSLPNSSSSKTKGKGKLKQVEFSSAVEVHLRTPPKQDSKGKTREPSPDTDSELTSLDEMEDLPINSGPSPRRLRSQDREDRSRTREIDLDATPVAHSKRQRNTRKIDSEHEHVAEASTSRKTRITPMRMAKRKIGSLRESDSDEPNVEDDDLLPEAEEEDGDDAEEEEVDELISSRSTSRSMSPQPQQKKPRRARRKRPRRAKALPSGDEENEGDDEEEVIEDEEEEGEAVDGDENAEEEEQDEDEGDEDGDATLAVEPRKLRNGKVVGEEAEEEEEEVDEMDVDESVGDEDEEAEEDGDEGDEIDTESVEGSEIDVDGETEVVEEVMEDDDIDLTIATAKTLVRLRRDDLIRLCESRAIDPTGTKPQLAEALLQWRDSQENDLSSPSSTGTVRPWFNSKRTRKSRKNSSTTTTNSDIPVLLRAEHVHLDEPRTPVPSKEKDSEDLELDLESLGLEDREIPPDKLTKLEKIGSGGFKDVFIGKFKGRKIAIAEFRGQLSAMDIKELKLLGEFNHPNIVRFMGVSIPENTRETPVMIVSELCSNGDLFDYVRNVSAPSLRKVLKLMLDIARGLEYLHKRTPSVIHRDCKSSNILITARGSAKIADFGLAKVKQSTRSMVRSLVGTVNWQAPELWNAHPKYNHKVDVFSCAMVFWEMLQWHQPSKKFPWEGMNEHAIYDLVGAKRQRPSISGLKKQWCPEIVELVEQMWAQEHQDRPTMTEVVETLEDLYSRH